MKQESESLTPQDYTYINLQIQINSAESCTPMASSLKLDIYNRTCIFHVCLQVCTWFVFFVYLRIEYLVFNAHQPVHTLACLAYSSQAFQPSCVKDFSWFPLSQHQQHYMNSLDERKSLSINLIPCFVHWRSWVWILEATSTSETFKHPRISKIEFVCVRRIVANRWRHWVGCVPVSGSMNMYLLSCCTLLKASTCK